MYISQRQNETSFINVGQMRLMELIEGVLQDKPQYRVFPEVTLARILPERLKVTLPNELQEYVMRSSSLDITICHHETTFSKPIIAIEKQSPEHDKPYMKEKDRKKASILRKARIPLFYVYEPDIGIIRFAKAEQPTNICCEVNVYRGLGRDKLREFLLSVMEENYAA